VETAARQDDSYEDALEAAVGSIPAGRFATPEEFAGLLVFLASERGSYVTGTTIAVDAGLTRSVF